MRNGVGTWLSCVPEEHVDLAQNPDGMEWTHRDPKESQALCRGEGGPQGVLRETRDLGYLLWVEEASALWCRLGPKRLLYTEDGRP